MDSQTWLQTLLSDRPMDGLEPPVLLVADADRVSEYVFETPGLPEMRGASAQLKYLNLEDSRVVLQQAGLPIGFVDDQETPPGCLVYAAGGGLLALVPASMATTLRAEIERRYPEHTGAATITCVSVDTTPEEVRQNFGDLVRKAGQRLRTAKGQKTLLPFFEMLPFTRRCDACRKRPATKWVAYPGEPPEARCRVCAQKRTEGQELRSEWHVRLGIKKSSRTLEDIAGESGEIGLVYADGNGLGDWFQTAHTVFEYRKRSRQVKGAVDAALLGALQTHCAAQGHPFEVILAGGDDVMLVAPASVAVALAKTICEQFEQLMQADKCTMSAGVVLADHHTPVYFLRRLADDVLKSAKRADRGSTVDFLVLKGQGTRSADQAWETVSAESETLVLHHGPYTLADLRQLLQQVQDGKVAGFSASQLYALRDSLRQGRQVSALKFLYQQARARSDKHAAFLRDFAAFWSNQAEETPPWYKSRDLRSGVVEYRTAWADLVDLWERIG